MQADAKARSSGGGGRREFDVMVERGCEGDLDEADTRVGRGTGNGEVGGGRV